MMNIVLITDENYVYPTGTTIASVLNSNPDENFTFYIVTKHLSDEHVAVLESFVAPYCSNANLKIITLGDDILTDFPIRLGDHVTSAAYYRVYLQRALPETLDKVLYLDGDILCVDSIQPFYSMDFDGFSCVVTHDERNDEEENFIRLKYPSANGYFCSGVMLINLDWWRKNNVMQKCLDFIAAEPEACLWHDQDALNHVLNGTVLWADFRYNFMQGYFFDKKAFVMDPKFYADIDRARLNPCLLHFSSAYKPWHVECNHPLKKQYRQFFKKATGMNLKLTHRLCGRKRMVWLIKRVLTYFKIRKYADFRKPVTFRKIVFYIHKMIYKFGGTEAYTAKLLELVQNLYPQNSITLVTECFKKNDALSVKQMIDRLNTAYGCVLSEKNFNVAYIATKDFSNFNEDRYNLIGRIIRFMSSSIFQIHLDRITKKYDLFINCSNQVVTGKSSRNITLVHFPHDRRSGTGVYNFPILKSFAAFIDDKYVRSYECFMPNSEFTAYWLRQKWGIDDKKIRVCYPPVTRVSARSEKNMHQIIICGRIEVSKKIHVMMLAFRNSDYLSKNCVLKIVGSCDYEDNAYIDYIKSLVTDRIQIIKNPSRLELEQLYAQSSVFWHAKGYGENRPMLMEHFGIVTVEAMSAGCIPVVINKGGQKEIVTDDCGYLWDEPGQMVAYTEELMKNPEKINDMRFNCIKRSKMYSVENLKNIMQDILAVYMEN